jgi:nicotinamidase-related amidase
MKGFFFFDIDTQRDLMLSGGPLCVPGAERMVSKVGRLFDFAKARGVTILSTAIMHTGAETLPPGLPMHCVRGTDGQRKIDGTLLLHPFLLENKPIDCSFADLVKKHQQIIIEKAGFDPFGNPAMEKLMRVLPQRAILFGVPAEHSVRLAALGLRRLGCKTVAIQNAILPLRPRDAAKAETDMRGAGVEFIAMEVLLGALDAG